jgi:hypothetical protein
MTLVLEKEVCGRICRDGAQSACCCVCLRDVGEPYELVMTFEKESWGVSEHIVLVCCWLDV